MYPKCIDCISHWHIVLYIIQYYYPKEALFKKSLYYNITVLFISRIVKIYGKKIEGHG